LGFYLDTNVRASVSEIKTLNSMVTD
jgi:hypothetical protein